VGRTCRLPTFAPRHAAAAGTAPCNRAPPRRAAPAPRRARRGGAGAGEADGRVAVLDGEHEDSVYGLAWSAADPWLLASMSYDGRVAVSAVPKNLKYKILV
jgi:EARP and GARP complex-interacting protein 1